MRPGVEVRGELGASARVLRRATRARALVLLAAALAAATMLAACRGGARVPLVLARARALWHGGDAASMCPTGTIAAGAPRVSEDDPVVTPRKQAWEAAHGGKEAARPYVRARLRGWPARALADRTTLPSDDRAFLLRVARDTWRGLVALSDRASGLPVDHVRLGDGDAWDADARVGDYTSITNVGMHLLAIVAAHELDLIASDAAVTAITELLDTLDRLETHAGFFFNYYDTTSLERTSNLISFVDTGWLTAGLIVARRSFSALDARCSDLLRRMDYRFFYDPALGLMSHGYYVHRGKRSRYHYGVLYTEARLGSVIAIGKGDVPEDLWFDMVRTYAPACAAQSARPLGIRRKTVHGHALTAGWYEWRGLRYVPSWGGSMFEALMPALVLDEVRHAPRSLGQNDEVHATVQRRYALEELAYPVWGMSPSALPNADGYGEFGVRVLGSAGYPPGAVTPHAAALALLVTPDAATADLRALAERYDVYGDFGFYDVVDPRSGAVGRAYYALNQSMILVAAANALKPHCIQRRFASDPLVAGALPVIGAEDFFE